MLEYEYIDTPAALAEFTRRSPQQFGFDTEFTYTRTFRPIPELLQIAIDDHVAIIDLQADLPLDHLRAWFQQDNITRIAHSAQNDIEVLNIALRGDVGTIEDTQLAYAFLELGQPKSYASLIQTHFDVELDKSMQASRWDTRPLSEAQLKYAALDIAFLNDMWATLEKELLEAGRLAWYQEERDRLQSPPEDDPSFITGNVSRITQMTEISFRFLQLLEQWRSGEAEKIDIPKNWILAKGDMLRLAGERRFSEASIGKVLSKKQASRHSHKLLRLHRQARSEAEKSSGLPLKNLRNSVRALSEECKHIAQQIGLSEELLGTQKDLLFAIRSYLEVGVLPGWFGKWRIDLIGEKVIEVADNIRIAGEHM